MQTKTLSNRFSKLITSLKNSEGSISIGATFETEHAPVLIKETYQTFICDKTYFYQLLYNADPEIHINLDELANVFSNKHNSPDVRSRALLLLFIYSTNKKNGLAECLQDIYFDKEDPSPLTEEVFDKDYLQITSLVKEYLQGILKDATHTDIVKARSILLLMLLSDNHDENINTLLNNALKNKSETTKHVLGVDPYHLLYDEQKEYLINRIRVLPAFKEK